MLQRNLALAASKALKVWKIPAVGETFDARYGRW
jgi:hypothetical protein